MSILLIILAIIAVLIALPLIIAAFTKKEYGLEREVIIDQPIGVVYDYLKLTKNQLYYNKWWMIDPNAKMEFKGVDGTVGLIASWDSEMKQAGAGEQETIRLIDSERIDWVLRFVRPFEGVADSFIITEKLGDNKTRVRWGFKSGMKYPMNFMLLLMNMEKMLGADLELTLNNLKNILENK